MSDSSFFTILFLSSISFGLFMGAYYGTMEYRIRQKLPLVTADCFCPSCGHSLPLRHQIPVLSFLFLKGKCRFCHAHIPLRYPLTESGFLAFYGTAFLLFRRMPAAYLTLWYGFICILLTARCGRHGRHLLKGLLIMALYHGIMALLYLILYDAFSL
ncbi:prepilin peptidase [uncultured Acetatifactor sp.]|jgi:prepilin signal peptidase PulO-like enzyme (type II secretory pathway)|uniref:prepilin peptidase n=1 Tax=uncultured Acetatifactor sp. TaxID=1671927 RepID=UPI0026322ECB|nr:prepilin peptidase [uncultured Acetatifactor sp.]